MSDVLVAASKAKTMSQRIATLAKLRPRDFVPITPAIAEPSTGESMGQSADKMAKLNGITREAQDRFALASHVNAAAGTKDGRLTAEIAPVPMPPRFESMLTSDNGIRADSSYESLAALRPVFDRQYGTVTAGQCVTPNRRWQRRAAHVGGACEGTRLHAACFHKGLCVRGGRSG